MKRTVGIFWFAALLVAANVQVGQAQTAGKTIWDGVYTEAQATRGLKLILKALAGDIAEDVPTPAQMRKLTGDRRRQT